MIDDPRFHVAEGMAALGICESLLLAMIELKIISAEAVRGLLLDVATTHENAAVVSSTPEKHLSVVDIVQRLMAGNHGIR